MKIVKSISGLVLLLLLAQFISSFTSTGNCDVDAMVDKCGSSLGDYTFIKTFGVDIKKSGEKPTEFSYVFSKGSNYRIVICDQNIDGNRMIVNFYDRNKKLVASNYLKSSKKFFNLLNYTCSATGVYYVESTFEGGKEGSGVNILGFK